MNDIEFAAELAYLPLALTLNSSCFCLPFFLDLGWGSSTLSSPSASVAPLTALELEEPALVGVALPLPPQLFVGGGFAVVPRIRAMDSCRAVGLLNSAARSAAAFFADCEEGKLGNESLLICFGLEAAGPVA